MMAAIGKWDFAVVDSATWVTNCDTINDDDPDLTPIWIDSEASVTEMAQFRLTMQAKANVACTDGFCKLIFLQTSMWYC